MYILIFHINKTLILPILYMNDAYFNKSFIKTAYAAIPYLLMKLIFSIKILHLQLHVVLDVVLYYYYDIKNLIN